MCLTGCVGAAAIEQGTGKVQLPGPTVPAPPGIRNFGVVWDGALYRGAKPDSDAGGIDGYATLISKYGVRTIVDLTNEPIDHWILHKEADCARMRPAEKRVLRYVRIPEYEAFPQRRRLLEFLRIATNPQNQPIFVHCVDGRNRTGAMIAGLRIIDQDWDAQDAIAETTNYGIRRRWKPNIDRFLKALARDRTDVQHSLSSAATDQQPVVFYCE
jgi:protein tyrosine/serine phosphatase